MIEDLGEPEMIREGLQSVYGQSVTSFFIDKAMEWKERTMKTEWKWIFAAQFGLALTIVLTVFFIGSAFVFIVPSVEKFHADVGIRFPDYLISTVSILRHISWAWWIWLIVLAGVLGLFEWKCKSENKALIRTVIGVGASLALIVAAFWVSVALAIAFVQLKNTVNRPQAESVVVQRINDADQSYKQLEQSIEDDDLQSADMSAKELRNAYRILRDMSAAPVLFAGENAWGRRGEFRGLICDIADLSDALHDTIRNSKDRATIMEHYARLKTSYLKLKGESDVLRYKYRPGVPAKSRRRYVRDWTPAAPQPTDMKR